MAHEITHHAAAPFSLLLRNYGSTVQLFHSCRESTVASDHLNAIKKRTAGERT